MRTERQPAVEMDDTHLKVARELVSKQFLVLVMQFDRSQPVLIAQHVPRNYR
jgi:hypothetical protein